MFRAVPRCPLASAFSESHLFTFSAQTFGRNVSAFPESELCVLVEAMEWYGVVPVRGTGQVPKLGIGAPFSRAGIVSATASG